MNLHGHRYLRVQDFAKYFHETAQPHRNHFSESSYLHELEFWEKERLFFPCVRLVLPKEYVAFFESARHTPGPTEFPPEGWPDTWIHLAEFLQIHERWHRSNSDDIYHPFDTEHGLREFFEDPRLTEFRSWKSFKFPIKEPDYVRQVSRAKHYYHYWQIHLLDALRRENTLNILGNFPKGETFDSLAKGVLPAGTFRRSLSTGYYIRSSDIRKIENHYELLSKYVLADKREFQTSARKHGIQEGGRHVIPPPESRKYRERCKAYGIKLLSGSRYSEDDWLSFLRTLCNLYVEYEQYERSLMAKELKKDIYDLLDLIAGVFGLEETVINARVGYPVYGGSRNTLLEIVFPNLLKEAKDDAIQFLEQRRGGFNAKVTSDYQLEVQDVRDLCEYLEAKGLWLVFRTLKEVDREWWEWSPFQTVNLFTCLRSLAVSIEDLIKNIGAETPKADIASRFVNGPARKQHLGNVLKWMFCGAPWWAAYPVASKKLTDVKPEDLEQRAVEILGGSFHSTNWMNFVMKSFLMLEVVRNYVMHKAVSREDFYRLHYIDALNHVTYALLFIWANAKNEKLLVTTQVSGIEN